MPVEENISRALAELFRQRSRNCQPVVGRCKESANANNPIMFDISLNPWSLSRGNIFECIPYQFTLQVFNMLHRYLLSITVIFPKKCGE